MNWYLLARIELFEVLTDAEICVFVAERLDHLGVLLEQLAFVVALGQLHCRFDQKSVVPVGIFGLEVTI